MGKRPVVDIREGYAAALALAERPGKHCSMSAFPSFVHPGLCIDGIEEELAWPLPSGQARDIVSHLASRTSQHIQVVDDSCCVHASALTFENPAWNTLVASLVSGEVRRQLGLTEFELTAALSHLVIDTKQASSAATVTPPRAPASSFATMVVAMPSYHEGGQLVVRLARSRHSFETSGKSVANMSLPHYCAFYHTKGSVVKTTSPSAGRRVWLVYHLTLQHPKPSEPHTSSPPQAAQVPPPPPLPPSVAASVSALRAVALTRHIRPQPYVHFLQYAPVSSSSSPPSAKSPPQLSWECLSGQDLAQAEALVATRFFDVYLTKMTRQHKRPVKLRKFHRRNHRYDLIHYINEIEEDFLFGSDYSDERDEFLNPYDDYSEDDEYEHVEVVTGPKVKKEKFLVGRLVPAPTSDAPAALALQAPVVTRDDFITSFPSATPGPHVALLFYPKTLRLQLLGLPKGVDALTYALKGPADESTDAAGAASSSSSPSTSTIYSTAPATAVLLLGYPSTAYMARRLVQMFRQHADQHSKPGTGSTSRRWHQEAHNEAAKTALLPMLYALVEVRDVSLLSEFLQFFFPTFLAGYSKYDGIDDHLFDALASTVSTFGVDAMYKPLRSLCQHTCALDRTNGAANCLALVAHFCGTPPRVHHDEMVLRGTQIIPGYHPHHHHRHVDDPSSRTSAAVTALWNTPFAGELVRGCFGDIVDARLRDDAKVVQTTTGGPHGANCGCPSHHNHVPAMDLAFLVQLLQVDDAIDSRMTRALTFLHTKLPSSVTSVVDSFAFPSLVARVLEYFNRLEGRNRAAMVLQTLAPALNHFASSVRSTYKQSTAIHASLRRLQPLVDTILIDRLGCFPDTIPLFNDQSSLNLSLVEGVKIASLAALVGVAASTNPSKLESVLAMLTAIVRPPVALVGILRLAVRAYPHIPLLVAETPTAAACFMHTAIAASGTITSLEQKELMSFASSWSYQESREFGSSTFALRASVVRQLFGIARALDVVASCDTVSSLHWSTAVSSHVAALVRADAATKDDVVHVFVPAVLEDGPTFVHQFPAWQGVASACIERLRRDPVAVPCIQDWSIPHVNVAEHKSELAVLASYFFRSPVEVSIVLQGREVAWVGDLSRLLHQLAAQKQFKHLFQVRQLSSRTARVKGRLEIVKLGTRATDEEIKRVQILRADRTAQEAMVTKLTALVEGRAGEGDGGDDTTVVPPKCKCTVCAPPAPSVTPRRSIMAVSFRRF
ncbi:hypothetical protein DYB34_010475 [Aphanomyces astaci]|uniref:Uncharacterized protein n=2 Tax=Aphanomyces astaci TaxID=112090 RepID=A0A418CB27_APHAT|nr:hypothetical protein DYB34_010475 [Aphanomyces astaci]